MSEQLFLRNIWYWDGADINSGSSEVLPRQSNLSFSKKPLKQQHTKKIPFFSSLLCSTGVHITAPSTSKNYSSVLKNHRLYKKNSCPSPDPNFSGVPQLTRAILEPFTSPPSVPMALAVIYVVPHIVVMVPFCH